MDQGSDSAYLNNDLSAGFLSKAKELKRRDYRVCGRVVRGNQLGRKLGFPTANIEPHEATQAIPDHGVYLVQVILEEQFFFGICNIGKRPTIGGTKVVTEVYIFNFDRDIYGKSVCLVFLERLRKEKKFRDLDALVKQINKDKAKATSLLSEFHKDYTGC